VRELSLSLETRLRRTQGLYRGLVRGQTFVHDPRGHDAIAVLSATATDLLDACDGRPFGEIARDLGVAPARLEPDLGLLLRNGFVRGEGLPKRPEPPTERVFNAWVHVTNACNLDCPYCYVEKDPHVLSEDTAQALIDAFVATATQSRVERIHVRYAGGEPMLRFAFIQRFTARAREALGKVGARLSAAILTNGTVVPEGAATWLRDHDVSVSVSMDGLETVQDAMRPARGGGGSFDRLLLGLDRLQAGGVRPYMLATVSATNLEHMPELTRFFLERGLGFRYSLVRDLEGGASLLDTRGVGWRRDGGTSLERRVLAPAGAPPMLGGVELRRVQGTFAACYDLIEAAMPITPSFRTTHRFCDLELRRPLSGKACGAGQSYLAISDRGRLSPCQAALHHEGTAPLQPDRSLAAVAPTLSHLGDFRRTAPNAECGACAFRHSCAGGCPLLLQRRDGHIDGRSPYCEVFRFVIPRMLRIAALEIWLGARAKRQKSLEMRAAFD